MRWLVLVTVTLLIGGCGSARQPSPPVSGPPSATATAPTSPRATGTTSRSPRAATVSPVPALLRLGSRGQAVRTLQRDLVRLTYLPVSAVDGVFGLRTWYAVVAFQGWSGLVRDGVVGPLTRRALARASRPRPWSTAGGYEVHIAQGVLLMVAGGRVVRAIHVSTGMPGRATPLGHFKILRRETMSWSVPFQTWMPLAQYFYGGYAMHEFSVVPPYPASHGCVRVPAVEAHAVWDFGRIGMRLWTAR